MAKHALRKGVTPAARPTEWTVAAVMLVAAATAFYNDRDVAALLAVAAATLPALATAAFAYLEKRRADSVTVERAVSE